MKLNRKLQNSQRSPEAGFTLIELLVVLGIIALLMALVAPQVLKYLGRAKVDTTQAQLKNVESALELYYLDNGQYPSQEQSLVSLVTKPEALGTWRGPYIKQKSGLSDAWGRPFIYKSPGDHGVFDLTSLGKDGKAGGEGEDQDIQNW